jgi:hypothetical protein
VKHKNCKHGEPFGGCCPHPRKIGAVGSVALAKGINYKNDLVLVFQLLNADEKPLAFMDLTRDEALGLSEQLKQAVFAIWGI